MSRALLAILLLLGCRQAAFADSAPAVVERPAAATLALACSGCHSLDENSESPLVRPLTNMPRDEFIRSMQDFKSGKRRSSIMNRVAKGYQDADFTALADYFARH